MLKPRGIPLQHPEYRYPPSTNPYCVKLQAIEGIGYEGNQTETRRGSWKKSFISSAKSPGAIDQLHVEIGCNFGHVLVEWAARNPRHGYVGIDWKCKAAQRTAEKAQKRGLENMKAFRAQAERLEYMFAPGEVDHFYLYFPDPWPKTRHHKNRFVNPENLKKLHHLTSAGGTFHIKTDHPGYFEWMERAVAEVPELWKIVERSADLHKDHPDPTTLTFPEVTLFEHLFIRQKLPIHSLKLQSI